MENAVRLCGAKFGNLYLREGDGLRAAAMHNAPPAYAEQRAGILCRPSPNTTTYRAIQTKQPAQIADITKLQAYVEGDPWLDLRGVARRTPRRAQRADAARR